MLHIIIFQDINKLISKKEIRIIWLILDKKLVNLKIDLKGKKESHKILKRDYKILKSNYNWV